MKTYKTLILAGSILSLALVSCKKERTCTCETKDTTTTVRTPRTKNGYTPSATTDVSVDAGKASNSWDNIKKSEMRTFADCLDQTRTSSNTYTTVQSISTPTTVPPSTFVINMFVTYTVDVTTTNESTLSNCEIE
jgi:hypothetical protein